MRALHLTPRGRMVVAVLSLAVAVVVAVMVTPSSDAKYGALNVPAAAYHGPPLTIIAGAHLRLSPRVLEEDGSTNLCAVTHSDFMVTPSLQTEPTTNGTWYGVRQADLPVTLQDSCRQRPLVWVNYQGVRAP